MIFNEEKCRRVINRICETCGGQIIILKGTSNVGSRDEPKVEVFEVLQSFINTLH